MKLGAVPGAPHAASMLTISGPGWGLCRDQGVTVGARGATAKRPALPVFLLVSGCPAPALAAAPHFVSHGPPPGLPGAY